MKIDWTVTAALVQAIASIVAIGIAIWVPFKITRVSVAQVERDKASRARIVQVSMLPTLYRLRSTTHEFLREHAKRPSSPSPDSDFFELVPEFTSLLTLAVDSGSIQPDLADLSVLLFKTREHLSDIGKLQRGGYHAAWINNKDLFIEAARNLHALSDTIISNPIGPVWNCQNCQMVLTSVLAVRRYGYWQNLLFARSRAR